MSGEFTKTTSIIPEAILTNLPFSSAYLGREKVIESLKFLSESISETQAYSSGIIQTDAKLKIF
jgi:hypothetical protein